MQKRLSKKIQKVEQEGMPVQCVPDISLKTPLAFYDDHACLVVCLM
jgi:hypothetical protein